MPLSQPVERKFLHQRNIDLRGYQRADGLWDIEAHLVDTKGYDFDNRWRGGIPAGEPIHNMWIRMTLDDDMTIQGLEAVSDHTPFPSCPEAADVYGRLVGVKIGPGWMEEVARRIRRVEGCTHLFELLRPMATAAFQTLHPARKKRSAEARPMLMNSCHGWREDGEAIAALYPKWHKPKG